MADQRGTCDGCGLPKRLNHDGTIRKHNRNTFSRHYSLRWEVCDGSGRPPRKEVPDV